MASSVTIYTQAVTRDLLAQFAGNQRMVKVMENLIQDVSVNVPSAIDDLLQASDSVRALADLAATIARAAIELAAEIAEAPVLPPPPLADAASELGGQLSEVLARLQAAEDRIACLEGGLSS